MSGNIKRCSTCRMSAYYANQPLPDTNARGPAMTQRPASTALLTIDSEDRYQNYNDANDNPTSPYNFTIRKNENLMAGFFTRLAVTEVNFPWTIPNINPRTYQIEVSYDISGSLTAFASLLITPGFYTPIQLAQELQRKIRLLDPGLSAFTMVYGNTSVGFPGPIPNFTYKTNVANNTIGFSPLPYNTQAYPYPPTSKQLFNVLGFTDANSNLLPQSSGKETYCQSIRYVDIVCNQLTSVSALKDQTSQAVVRDMLCRIYLGDGNGSGQSTVSADASGANGITFCPPGCAPLTIYRNFTNPKQIQWLPNQNIPGFLQFQIYDDTGVILSDTMGGTGGIDWSMTILVTEN